jgi:septal ring factor EnvC (AmiA/AmiB activator)
MDYTFRDVVSAGGFTALGAIGTAFFRFLTDRGRQRGDAQVLEQFQKRLESLERDRTKMQTAHTECERKNAKLSAEVSRLRAEVSNLRFALSHRARPKPPEAN